MEITLITNKNLTVKIKSDKNIYTVIVNGSVVLDENGKANEFKTEVEAKKFALSEQVSPYIRKFTNHFLQLENPALLSGAGTSLSDKHPKDQLGLTMKELWKSAEKEVGLKEFAEEIGVTEEEGIEVLLSRALMKSIIHPEDIDIPKRIALIEDHIAKKCSLPLPKNSNHEVLLQKLSNRHSHLPRTRLFTLNYDTLFEQASRRTSTILLDGFSFTQPRHFRSKNFDLDVVQRENSRIEKEGNYLRSVIKFFKLHGSIDWYETKEGTVQTDTMKANRKLIYPKDTKYEQTYSQPFFEMMAQFQQLLRKQNTCLVVIGYSFNDKHINSVIKEALISNPMLELFVVSPSINNGSEFKDYLIDKTKTTSRITLWAATFGDFVSAMPDKMYSSPEEIENL